MRAILINPYDHSIKFVESTPDLDNYYKLIGDDCDCIDTCMAFSQRDEMLVVGDTSALQDPPLPHFTLEGYWHSIYGRALVIGLDPAGESVPTKLTPQELQELVSFQTHRFTCASCGAGVDYSKEDKKFLDAGGLIVASFVECPGCHTMNQVPIKDKQ